MREPIASPETVALEIAVAAFTAVRCCRSSPGFSRLARMSVMTNGFPVTSESASDERRIWPPPSPCEPSMVIMKSSIIRLVGIFDDEAGLQTCDFLRQISLFDGFQDLVEILVCGRGFVFGVLAAVGEDVGVVEGLVDFLLVEFADGGFAAFDSAGAVVDGVVGFSGAFGGDHDGAPRLRVPGEKNRMAGLRERRVGQRRMMRGKRACRSFAMHPTEFRVSSFEFREGGFLAGDVVRDEVDEVAFCAGEDFLEGFENERVDQQMVEGGEVGAEGHVVDVAVGFVGAEGRVDQLFVVCGQGSGPFFEEGLELLELVVGELIAEAAWDAAVGEKGGDVVVFEAEGFGDGFLPAMDMDGLGFAEVVSAAVGAELGDFVGEVGEDIVVEELIDAAGEGVGGVVGAEVERVFTASGPIGGDAEGFAVFL